MHTVTPAGVQPGNQPIGPLSSLSTLEFSCLIFLNLERNPPPKKGDSSASSIIIRSLIGNFSEIGEHGECGPAGPGFDRVGSQGARDRREEARQPCLQAWQRPGLRHHLPQMDRLSSSDVSSPF